MIAFTKTALKSSVVVSTTKIGLELRSLWLCPQLGQNWAPSGTCPSQDQQTDMVAAL